jgi:hypothetical protein
MMKENIYLHPNSIASWRLFRACRKLSFIGICLMAMGLTMTHRMNAQCDTPINAFPFEEGFETGSSSLPDCWESIPVSPSWYYEEYFDWDVVSQNNNGTITPNTGDGMAQAFQEDYYATSILSTPALDLTSLTTPYLKFYFANVDWSGDVDYLRVIYKTSADGEWNALTDWIEDPHYSWQELSIALPNPSAEYYIGFYADLGYGYGLNIDDVWIGEAPPCLTPSALVVSNINTNGANFSWTASASNPENGYAWEVRDDNGDVVDSGTTMSTSSSSTSLTFGVYSLYVKSLCEDEEESEWVGPASFSIVMGDVCGTAINLNNQTSPYIGTTSGAAHDFSGPCNGGNISSDLFFSISVPANYTLVIGNTATGYDSEIYAGYGDCPGSGGTTTQIACWDDPDIQNTTWTNTTGVDQVIYWVQDGYNSSNNVSGTFTLAWTLTPPPTCIPVTSLTATATSSSTADIAWVAPSPAGIGFEYYVAVSNNAPTENGEFIDVTSATLEELSANTTYYVFVRTDCGDGDYSTWVGPISFTTPCDVITALPFHETFETNSDTRACWSQQTIVGNGLWTYNTGSTATVTTANNGTLNARFVSGSGTASPVTKLISPTLNITTLDNPRLVFHMAQPSWGSDVNELIVYYRTAADENWEEIAHFDEAINSWTEQILALPNPSSTYQIAFEGINNYGRANVIDDVIVESTPPCLNVTGLELTALTMSSASFEWTASASEPEDGYAWTVTDGESNVVADGTTEDTEVTVTDLDLFVPYTFSVVAACGDDAESAMISIPFVIDYCVAGSTSNLGQYGDHISNVSLFGADTLVNPSTYNANGYQNFSSLSVSQNAGLELNFSISAGSEEFPHTKHIWVDWNNDLSFGEDELVYLNISDDIDPTTTGSLAIAFDQPEGLYRMRIRTQDGGDESLSPCGNEAWSETEDYTLVVLPAPPCLPPTALTLESLSDESVVFSWTTPGIEAEEYYWYITDEDGNTVVDGSTVENENITAEGLLASSNYTIHMYSDCGDENLSPESSISFTTPCTKMDQFPYVESFEDDSEWLDCWSVDNNSYAFWDIGVGSGNGVIEEAHSGENNAALYGGGWDSAVLFTPVMDMTSLQATGAELNFWYANPLDWDYDVMEIYYLSSPNGTFQPIPDAEFYSVVNEWTEVTLTLPNISEYYQLAFVGYSYDESLILDDVVIRAIEVECDPVTNIEAVSTDTDSAIITWTASETIPSNGYDWLVYNEEEEVVTSGTSEENVANVSGLTANTTYTIVVITVCDDINSSEPSEAYEFTTAPIVITGCTDETACNYNPDATEDDGSCSFEPLTWYIDADGDGYGDASETEEACQQPEGYVSNNTDCDDSNADVWTSAELYVDADGDGYDAGSETVCYGEELPEGYATETLGTDCNDEDAAVYQSAELYVDADGDGYDSGSETVCYGEELPEGYAIETLGTDCDDEDAAVYQSATLYIDADGDGYDSGSETVCYGEELPEGYATETLGTDCDDEDDAVYQSATLYIDADGDGYHGLAEEVCYGEEIPEGFVTETEGEDCNDEDDSVWTATIIEVNLVLPVATICDNASPLTLTGGSPANGVWSGQSVVNGVFNPAGLAADNYTITYTVAGDGVCIEGNEASAVITVDDCSGINEQDIATIQVYPTVTADFVRVVGHNLQQAVVMDMNGKSIQTVSLNTDATINVQSLAAGVYFVQVTSNTATEVFRVVKVN